MSSLLLLFCYHLLMGLLLDEIGHGIAFCLVSLYIFQFIPKLYSDRAFVFGLVSTYFIDLDHLFDYFLNMGFSVNFSKILTGSYFGENQKIYVLLHSWELVALLLGVFLFSKNKLNHKVLFFIFVAFAMHLTYDLASYGFDYKVYFALYRLINSFDINVFLT